jgi:sulfur relay (sulfurtransferase) DsrC/TusE family protein
VDVRVEAGVAEVKEQWEEKLAEALAEREEQEAALRTQGRDIVRQQREHLEQKSEEALNALRAELQEVRVVAAPPRPTPVDACSER